jgi:hypothetical protein
VVIIGAVVQTRTNTSLANQRLHQQAIGDCTNTGECVRVGACVVAIGMLALLFVADIGALESLSALLGSATDYVSRLLYGMSWPR